MIINRGWDKTKIIIFLLEENDDFFAYTKLVSVPGTLSAGTAPGQQDVDQENVVT